MNKTPTTPSRDSDDTPRNRTGLYLVGILFCSWLGSAQAETAIDLSELLAATAIEEIVVIATPNEDEVQRARAAAADALRERVERDIEQHRLLEEEIRWRTELAAKTSAPDRVSWGYDVASSQDTRAPESATLPLDLVQPAAVIRFSFD